MRAAGEALPDKLPLQLSLRQMGEGEPMRQCPDCKRIFRHVGLFELHACGRITEAPPSAIARMRQALSTLYRIFSTRSGERNS